VQLDDGCGIDQNHHLETTTPDPVQPTPEQAVATTKPLLGRAAVGGEPHLMSEASSSSSREARRRNQKKTNEAIADRIVNMPATIRR
jgi:hypothetical protein